MLSSISETVKQSVLILMLRVPDGIDVDLLQTKLRHVEHVQCVMAFIGHVLYLCCSGP